jgi:hypothetical protein
MQLIRDFPVDLELYLVGEYFRRVERPRKCPHCTKVRTLWALGYYCRNISRLKGGFARLWIRRFRCCFCGKTVSILPSFAQPYRLVQNSTIEGFVRGGPWSNDVVRCFPLLQLYWKRFVRWLPEIERSVTGSLPRPPPTGNPREWWNQLLASYNGLDATTKALVSSFQMTLYGRYLCHRPNSS